MSRAGGQIFKSTIIITFFTLLNGILNYLTLMVLAYRFGARTEMDAFFAATTIPQLITAILLATLSTTFIPVFIETRSKDESNAWKVASITTNLIFLVLFIIAVMGSLFSESLISLINPGFTEATSILSTSLFRILFVSLLFSGTSIILTSIYYAHQKFLRPLLAQGFNSLVVFLFVILLGSILGIKSIAVGTLVGSLLQFLYLLPILLRKERYSFEFDFQKKEIRRLASLILPLFLGTIFYKSNTLVERFIASRLEEGCISYLSYAYKILNSLLLVITMGISTALFPRMSEYSAIKDFKGLQETLSKGIRALLVITVPTTFAFVLARLEIVRVIFERGDFSRQTTEAVANALVAFLGFFIVGSISLPIVNTLYSLKETAKVAGVGIFGFILYIVMAFTLSSYYSYVGIAVATSIQYILNLMIFIYILKRKLGSFQTHDIVRCAWKTILASGFTFFILSVGYKMMAKVIESPFNLIILGIFGMILYFLTLIILKTEELKLIPIPFFKK